MAEVARSWPLTQRETSPLPSMEFHFSMAKVLLLLALFLRFLQSSSLDTEALLARQEEQLNKLEALVEALSRTLPLLESPALPPTQLPMEPSPSDPGSPLIRRRHPVDGITVTKYKPSWMERFRFLAAARIEHDPTCAAVLPYEDHDGVAKYFAVGDANGKIYVFSSSSDVVLESTTPSGSEVTAMLSYMSLRRNESFLFSGHRDGSIFAHRMWESTSNGDDWVSLFMGSSQRFMGGGGDSESSPVVLLESLQVGRLRYLIASDAGGRITVFSENGKVYGSVMASSRPLAFMKQRMVFLTENAAGWLDLRRMAVRESKCEGLNGSVAETYAFDASEQLKAYGYTSAGSLIHLALHGDGGNLKCRVRAAKKVEIEGPVSIHAIKGYLLVVNSVKVFLYNVTSQYYGRIGAPRLLFSATLEEVKTLFLDSPDSGDGSPAVVKGGKPLLAGDRDKLVVLGLGSGYIGIYKSNFPVFKVQSSAVLWSTPVLLFIMFLIGLWHFYVKKRESLGWSPEETFTPPVGTTGGLLGPGTGGERGFAESSRAAEARDARGSALRGPARRYPSPTSRFPAGGKAIPFRGSSAEPGIRGGPELKFRGQGVDSAGFPMRRDPIYSNSQALDEHVE